MDLLNAKKFSPFMISHKIDAPITDEGVCMVSNIYGAVCLLSNDNYNGMVTYRLSIIDWYNIITNTSLPASSDVINQIKNTEGALQDTRDGDAVEWMNAYFCY